MRLDNKFCLPNATGTALDIVRQILGHAFAIDQCLHVAQAIYDAKVRIAPIHEAPRQLLKRLRLLRMPSDAARLQHSVTFPVASVLLIVILQ